MTINFEKTRKDAEHISLENSSYMNGMVGFWANVSEVHSDINAVDVVSDTGIYYKGLPVASQEWVNVNTGKDKDNNDMEFVSCSRTLPQVGSRVFILAPTHTITGAFVLCSGYAAGATKKQVLYADSEDRQDIKKKNLVKEIITQGGWHITEYYQNGNLVFESLDGTMKFSICPQNNNQEGLKKGINIEAYGNSIVATDRGLTIKDCNGNTIETNDQRISFNGYLTVKTPPENPEGGV